MAIFSAVALDLAYKRFGGGYKWLLWFGPVFVLIFYVTEYFWAWYLSALSWWPIVNTLEMVPVGIGSRDVESVGGRVGGESHRSACRTGAAYGRAQLGELDRDGIEQSHKTLGRCFEKETKKRPGLFLVYAKGYAGEYFDLLTVSAKLRRLLRRRDLAKEKSHRPWLVPAPSVDRSLRMSVMTDYSQKKSDKSWHRP